MSQKMEKRADGRYQVKLSLGKDGNGKEMYKYFYGKTVREAEQAKQDFMWSVMHPTTRTAGHTFLEWRDLWMESYKANLSANTKAQYTAISDRIARFEVNGTSFGEMDMRDILPLHIAKYVLSLDGMSKSMIAINKLVLNDIFSAAEDNGVIEESPCKRMPKVNGTYTGHKALSREEISAITNFYDCHRYGLLFLFLLWTGCRKGEAFALTWDKVDFDRDIIHITESRDIKHGVTKAPKTSAGCRDIPMLPPLRKALWAVREQSGLVFHHNGEYFTDTYADTILDSFIKMVERAVNGVADPSRGQGFRMDKWVERNGEWKTVSFNYHDLRATFATIMYDAGVDAKSAQKFLGHADVQTTLNIYTKLSTEHEDDSISKITAFANGVSTVSKRCQGPNLSII